MTDFVRPIIRFHPTMRVDFSFIIALKFSYIFFLHICFAIFFLCKGLKPPCDPMELYNCLSIKVIRQPICRHEQLSLSETLSGSRLFERVARVKALLDFLLAQSTPPVALRACRRRLFAPRDSARPEIRCLG